MANLIDYAGMFPPARLQVEESLANYMRFQNGPESAVVDRFVCDVPRLPKLAEALGSNGSSIRLSVVGSGGATIDEFETNLESDATAMNDFLERAGDMADIECFEAKAPFQNGFDRALRDLEAFRDIDVFVEIPLGEPEDMLAQIAETEWMGAKARSGGLTPETVPSEYHLAGFLQQALDLDVPFKLTAGLHEPLRHFDAAVGAKVHGFLNIAVASMLHLRESLSRAELAEVLGVEQAAVAADADTITWSGESFGLGEVRDLRVNWRGIGSCSVDEPLQGLAKLGLMAVNA